MKMENGDIKKIIRVTGTQRRKQRQKGPQKLNIKIRVSDAYHNKKTQSEQEVKITKKRPDHQLHLPCKINGFQWPLMNLASLWNCRIRENAKFVKDA